MYDYGRFFNALRKRKGNAFYNTWIIESDQSAHSLFDELYALMDPLDRLAVCELSGNGSRRANMPGEDRLKVL